MQSWYYINKVYTTQSDKKHTDTHHMDQTLLDHK